jgi:two-component system NtrC family sensor kinase
VYLRANLTTKFILAALAVVCGVLAGHAAISVGRERALFERDMTQDAQLLARALAVPFARTWRDEGEGGAFQFLRQVQAQAAGVQLAWRPISGAGASLASGARLDQLATPLAAVSWRDTRQAPGDLVTLVRTDSPTGTPGILSVRESLNDERRYIGASVRNHLITLVVLLALAGLGMWTVGRHFVGRPVDLLVGKARRAGTGDLSGPIRLRQRDELRELADEMNDMCAKLAESRQHLESETDARLAAVEQLRHAERLATVGRLAAGVAHELGTPLSVVLARASVIPSAPAPAQIAEHVAAIERQVARMTQIIRGLLDFARRTPPRRTRVDTQQVASATAQLLRAMASAQGLAIEVDPPAGDTSLTADEGQLSQVMTNLVVNAIQAGHAGGHVRLTCRGLPAGAAPAGPGGERLLGPAVLITVADDGAGMSAEVRRQVFEPFFTTKEVGQGTGLGMAISHGIVHEHGGFIDVTSAPGQGTQFFVFLPGRSGDDNVV